MIAAKGNCYMLAQPREPAITSTSLTTVVDTGQDATSTLKGCRWGNSAKRKKIGMNTELVARVFIH